MAATNPNLRVVRQGQLDGMRKELIKDLQTGRIAIPQSILPETLIQAGGVNHCPDSDLSYSHAAATVQGTLPATAGDGNQRAWRMYRQRRVDNVLSDDAHGLKAVGHSLFAANEGANPNIPRWDRVGGWIEIGSAPGFDQYDIGVQLLSKLVAQSQVWFFLFRCVSLTPDVVPAELQLYVGLWQRGVTEGWATGDAFQLFYTIHGAQGSTSANYRVLAKTDSGVSVLSTILNVPNSPDVPSPDNYVTLFFTSVSNAGFIEFHIYKEVAGVFSKLFTIRNSVDFLYHDTGSPPPQPASGWPAAGASPLAYAQTRRLRIGAFGGAWALNSEVAFHIPPTYNYADTNPDGQILRFGLTAPTAVHRQIGLDLLFFSTTYSKWAPDLMSPFADGSYPVPSVSPTSGNQGSGGGLGDPPPPGGGRPCILINVPVLVKRYDGESSRRRKQMFVPYKKTVDSDLPIADRPYRIVMKKTGTAAGYYVIKTRNGIRYPCNARHELALDVEQRTFIQAEQVEVGKTRLVSWVRGRRTLTLVISKKYVAKPVDVGTYVLQDLHGDLPTGRGMFVAGFSKKMDRGLFASNIKLN